MALKRCPDCHNKISEHTKQCIHCGFSFLEADLTTYQATLEKRRVANQIANRKNSKLQLIWLGIFSLIISVGIWLNH